MEGQEYEELIGGMRDMATVKRVYGDAYEKNGMTVIPAATVRGGAGRRGDDESGSRGGFGMVARPSGAWIIEDGRAEWKPAVDVNRVILGGQVVGLAAILVAGWILHAHSKSVQHRIELARAFGRLRRLTPGRPARRFILI
jgi:hypothetical protein